MRTADPSRPSRPAPPIDLLQTARSIAAVQSPSGAVRWPDGHADPWDHIECAMALSACGLAGPTRSAYQWLLDAQRRDGAWPRTTGGPDAAAIGFPAYCPARRFRLAGTEVRVGRRSESRGIHPEIDLTGPPADPGVSRLHVVLVAAPDGSWSAVDPGSANGTLVNGDEIASGETVPLRAGDVIHLGAWTALTLQI